MASFNFQAALASGASPQAITNYLSSQGMGSLASAYFNQNPNPNTGGGTSGNPLTSLANYAASVGKATPTNTPGANSPVVTGTDPRLQGINQGTGANIGSTVKDTGNTIVKPFAQTAVSAIDAAAAAKDLALNGGKPSVQATQDLEQPRNLGPAGTVAPFSDKVTQPGSILPGPGTLQAAGAGFQMAGTADAAAGAVEKLPALADKVSDLLPDIKTAPTAPTAEDATKLTQDVIKNPLTVKEQQAAVGQGKVNINGLNKEISYEPDARTQAMSKSLEPLAQDGRLQAPTTPENQVSNIAETQNEATTQGQQIREGLSTSKAIWNGNELQGRLDSIELPNVVKSETALTKQAEAFKQGVVELAEQADKHPVGLLDLRQQTDQLITQDFGKNFFDGDKNATALRQYIYSVRDELNNFAANKLPDGQLPSGVSYRDALKTQSSLINAKDQMTEKFVREFPEGSTNTSRFMNAHPMLRRFGLRAVMQVGAAATGLTLGVSALRKAVSDAASGK